MNDNGRTKILLKIRFIEHIPSVKGYFITQSERFRLLTSSFYTKPSFLGTLTFTMAEPILWISPGACSLAPHILIREAEIDFKTVVISAKAGFPEELRDVIPKARVPIFQLGDETITEVAAIMSAISQISTKKNLLGKTNLEIVRTYEWFNWISGTLHGQAFGGIRRPHRFSDEQEDSRGKLYVRKGVDKTHDHRR